MSGRVADWESRLKTVFASYEKVEFAWGATDCAHFAAACVKAITGRDALGTFRGSYRDRLSAAARLRGRGYRTTAEAAGDALRSIGAVEIDPRYAMAGDVGVTADGTLAVRMPAGFLARMENGKFGVAHVVKAWAIGWQGGVQCRN